MYRPGIEELRGRERKWIKYIDYKRRVEKDASI